MALLTPLAFAAISVSLGNGTAQELRVYRDPEPSKAVVIGHADLDLTRSSNARQMLNRLRMASQQVCAVGRPAQLDVSWIGPDDACLARTMESALERLHAPMVSALYHSEARRLSAG